MRDMIIQKALLDAFTKGATQRLLTNKVPHWKARTKKASTLRMRGEEGGGGCSQEMYTQQRWGSHIPFLESLLDWDFWLPHASLTPSLLHFTLRLPDLSEVYPRCTSQLKTNPRRHFWQRFKRGLYCRDGKCHGLANWDRFMLKDRNFRGQLEKIKEGK